MSSVTQTLRAAGPSAPIAIGPRADRLLPPSILCAPSARASLTYSIEVTADQPTSPNAFGTTAQWYPFDSSTTGLMGPTNQTLAALVTGIRVNVTAYTSGNLAFGVVQ